MFLDKSTFTTVIDSTPLVSIDLVVSNENGEVLLGKRVNRPAKGYWFVPGGRIQKNESLAKAFLRLTQEELGKQYSIKEATLQGPYDHFYDDFVFGDQVSTHYVAIAYQLQVLQSELELPLGQHNEYAWLAVSELTKSSTVHQHTKLYFL
ncbi:GDP-mannose mannosyl hydrolase [Alteromonas sediminis]|uniref:GDP-mannose mannosyl hydrolase n=1 Tax=Alteromonas sediminis TaxID=2259342 RepID=A0A3N5YF22_9ALTE|nr:GDP-mannose mannosyl hydrolase [Alteromonas sediminis]RPJ68515.1 GDP-mannose mannosyl hydrolase [Alteromonas sediminis]